MSGFQSMRTAATWGAFGLLTGVGVTLAVILVTGVSVADEPGAPLGSERIAVSGDPSTSPSPSLTPNSSGGVSVVPAPGPTEVKIDDHGGDGPDDDSSGGSGNGGSGNGGSDNSGSGKGGSDDVESDDD